MMRRTSLALAAVGATAALAVAGAALGATTADRSAPTPAALTGSASTDDDPHAGDDMPAAGATPGGTAAGTTDGTVSRQRAAQIALAHLGGGRVVEIEAELEHGRPEWSVRVVRDGVRYEVEVDRGDGAVVGTERNDDHGDD